MYTITLDRLHEIAASFAQGKTPVTTSQERDYLWDFIDFTGDIDAPCTEWAQIAIDKPCERFCFDLA